MNENLGSIIAWLYPQAKTGPFGDWVVEQAGVGQPFLITRWVVPNVPQPTVAEVMSREADWIAYRDGTEGKADRVTLPNKVLASLVLRAGSAWTGYPLAFRNKVMAILDAAATDIVNKIS